MKVIVNRIIKIMNTIGIKKSWFFFKKIVKDFFKNCFYFGLKISYYNFLGEFANADLLPGKLNKIIRNKNLDVNINYLEKKFGYLIEKYQKIEVPIGKNCKKIWCCRWQGEEKAPELVKICINSIKNHNCGYEVILLDENNYSKYVKLPDFVIKKYNENRISITHLSDIIRMYCLKVYGGIWVDATMFINCDVIGRFDDIILNSNYAKNFINDQGGYTKWSCYFIGGKSNKLFSFVYEFLVEYQKNFNTFINYFWLDYAIYIAYRNFKECREYIDNINIFNEDYLLTKNFNEKYDKQFYGQLTDNTFCKLTYKWKFNKFIVKEGKKIKTIYGKFLDDYGVE